MNYPKHIKYRGRIYEAVESNNRYADVTAVDLLSIEETKQIPQDILQYDFYWWLQSPGGRSNYAACALANGTVDAEGYIVNYGDIYVRPAFMIPNLKEFNLSIGEEIMLGDIKCIVISDDKVLYDDELIDYWFDSKSNNYAKSEIKRKIQDEFGKYLGKQNISQVKTNKTQKFSNKPRKFSNKNLPEDELFSIEAVIDYARDDMGYDNEYDAIKFLLEDQYHHNVISFKYEEPDFEMEYEEDGDIVKDSYYVYDIKWE